MNRRPRGPGPEESKSGHGSVAWEDHLVRGLNVPRWQVRALIVQTPRPAAALAMFADKARCRELRASPSKRTERLSGQRTGQKEGRGGLRRAAPTNDHGSHRVPKGLGGPPASAHAHHRHEANPLVHEHITHPEPSTAEAGVTVEHGRLVEMEVSAATRRSAVPEFPR